MSPSSPPTTDHSTTSAAVELHAVSRSFGSTTVLDGLDLTVAAGEVFALLGANGAGKTTAISILTTLIRPDHGSVHVSGIDALEHPHEARSRFAVTGQSVAVDGFLTAAENLVLLGRLSGLSRRGARSRATRLAERFDLTSVLDRRVGVLSGGMRRRLDLALSLVVPVEILVLDEPTTGLDARSRHELWAEIRALAAGGTTVFLTTQHLEEADALADRIGLLHRGRLAGLGTPAELKAGVGVDTVVVEDVRGRTAVDAPTDGTVAGVSSVLSHLDPSLAEARVSLRHPSLDDVFLALTADRAHPAAADRSTPTPTPTTTTTTKGAS